MHRLSLVFSILVALVATGCAHPIAMNPDSSRIVRAPDSRPINKNVGYYIAPQQREMAVKTPGGGGDKVTYHPYRDIEAAFYQMLGSVFNNVTVLKDPGDAAAIAKDSLSYVITPEIVTSSYSPSVFTWPPTEFSVNLTCSITDGNGKQVAAKSVIGQGKAEFSEFKSDFSLSARRASEDALLKMQRQLLDSPELRE